MAYLVAMAVSFATGSDEERFIALVPQTLDAARKIRGFIGAQFWRSLTEAHLLLSDSYWETEEAADEWFKDPFHKSLQKLAYEGLALEIRTDRWNQAGDAFLYQRCAVCGTQRSDDLPISKMSVATKRPDLCRSCGFKFPVTPDPE